MSIPQLPMLPTLLPPSNHLYKCILFNQKLLALLLLHQWFSCQQIQTFLSLRKIVMLPSQRWKAAMEAEINVLAHTGTWELVSLPLVNLLWGVVGSTLSKFILMVPLID